MKTTEIRALKTDERVTRLRETRQELMHERGLAAMGGAIRNPGKIRALRTTIARIITIQGETARAEPAKAKSAKAKAPKAAAPAKAAKKKKKTTATPAKGTKGRS